MERKVVSIIGHFGGGEFFLDGQTVKTKILYEELSQATEWEIQKVDTYYKKSNPVKLLWQTLGALWKSKDIIVLLSGNGMKCYFPVLYFVAKLFGTRVYHDVIGGNLSEYVEKNWAFKKYLNSFQVNWVETNSMKVKLEAQGVNNVVVMPNFKRLSLVSVEEAVEAVKYVPPYRFCTFSRVMREKGIEDAVAAIESVNLKYGKTLCTLDIYGKVDPGYEERFVEIKSRFTDAVSYCGVVDFRRSVETLKDYYALLFPTFWDGEGFAGTIIDAFSAGLPVIATDWNCNGEIISNGVDGILYPSEKSSTLENAIEWIITDPEKTAEMRRRCVEKAELYLPEKHVSEIVKYIERGMSRG